MGAKRPTKIFGRDGSTEPDERRTRRTTNQTNDEPDEHPYVGVDFNQFFAISGRTDLRKGVSEAKFDGQADFDVKKSPAPPKSAENHEKPKTNREKNSKNIFFFDFVFDSESFETRFVLATIRRSKNREKRRKIREQLAKIRERTPNSPFSVPFSGATRRPEH